MADPKILFQLIKKWEGGWSNHPKDKGGKTNMGITLQTWKACGYDKDGDGDIDADDLKLITVDDVYNLFYRFYWKRWQADSIRSQSLGNICVDWVWASGSHGIVRVQRLLGLKADGIVGPKTLYSLNSVNAREFFQVIKSDRIKFVDQICIADPEQEAFRKGWINRINDIKFIDK